MNDTITVTRGEVLDSESLLQSAMDEINDAIKFGTTRDNATAKHILQNAVPLRRQIDALLCDCCFTDRPYPDAYKALRILREACHWSEAARQNYKRS